MVFSFPKLLSDCGLTTGSETVVNSVRPQIGENHPTLERRVLYKIADYCHNFVLNVRRISTVCNSNA